jgi:hypothetical protein
VHVDTLIILMGILFSVLWMDGKFKEIKKDILIIKTALIMRNIMPTELASKELLYKQKETKN